MKKKFNLKNFEILKFLGSLRKFKNTEFSKISVRHDMCEAEREITKQLATEAKVKNNARTEEEAKNFIYRVRGPPGHQYLKKVTFTQR